MWAALFPGQGSQSVGMGRFLFDNFKSVKELFELASDNLKIDFRKLCFEGPESDLALTENTQPALLLVSTSSFKVLEEVSPLPWAFAAGHSVGEYAALVSAKALDFEAALKAVQKRGRFMQSAVPLGEGSMLATLGLTPAQTEKLCQWAMEQTGLSPLEIANDNAPGQIVISGMAKITEWLQDNFSPEIFTPPPRRCKLIPLKVSAPFHCSMMKSAEEKMRELLETLPFSAPKFPIVQNYTAQASSDPKQLREHLVCQVSGRVRWVESVEFMQSQGVTRAVELGRGQVLKGLVKKISKDIEVYSFNSLKDLKVIENL